MKTCATRRARSSILSARSLPLRQRVILAGGILGTALVLAGLLPSDAVEAKRIAVPLQETAEGLASAGSDHIQSADQEELSAETASRSDSKQATAEENWQSTEVRRGDNLSLVFARIGLSAKDVQELLQSAGSGKELTRLFPGQQLTLRIDENGRLLNLRLRPDRLNEVEYRRQGEQFERVQTVHTPERRKVYKQGRLQNSLFVAAEQAGLSDKLIMELAGIFSGVIDFVLDPRSGDTFSLIYEELWLDGERIGSGNIFAAEYTNQGKRYAAYRYVDNHGDSGYFDEQGVSMQKAFLRAPLDFTRISSNFNLRRVHPVHKRVRAHRGIDYAAPTGTPVFAAGDGQVIASGYNRANGNYVFLRHGDRYTTKYLHLSKRKVKQGQRVKQKHVIGLVGATGLATGPHLHYEFLIDGVHRNPRTIVDQLPRARSIASTEKPRFLAAVSPYAQQLEQYRVAWQQTQTSEPPQS